MFEGKFKFFILCVIASILLVGCGQQVPEQYREAMDAATQYSEQHMSRKFIFTLIASDYGVDAAEYVVDNLDTDYKTNALEMAKGYQKIDMSPEEIMNQLTSQYGEMFTFEEAAYAIEHLND